MLAALALTRGITIKHNFMGHPDEHVFYGSTEMLMYDILYGEQYEPLKAYPEGTYVFRLPFHFAAQLIELEDDYTYNVRLWGRISSVFYYSLGCVLALWLVVRALGGGKAGAIIYALTACFSLFQLEISRYGTFDPVSFFVLMLAIVMLCQYIRRGKDIFILAASFCIAVAAAGKYSLAYFFVLPAALLIMQKREKKLRLSLLMLICAAVAFILFSPSIIRNPRFFIDTVFGGLSGYIVGGNPEGYSTAPESLFSAIVYQLFYSDLPLSGILALLCAARVFRENRHELEGKFFGLVLPAALLVFLAYNCLLTTFFLRTLFPFYCIASVYAAAGLGRVCGKVGLKALAVLLCALMIVRTAYCVSIMADEDAATRRADEFVQLLETEQIKEVIHLGNFFVAKELTKAFAEQPVDHVTLYNLLAGEFPEIEEGQLIITDSLEHGWAKYCLFAPNKEQIKNITQGWEDFKADNEEYLLGTLYPQHYYWLFGYWVHGSTATNYEFPNCYVYYRAMS